MSRELLQQAANALHGVYTAENDSEVFAAIAALEAELAKPEQATLESTVRAHIKDLQECAKALEDYPQFAATRLEICKAVEELGSALSGSEQASGFKLSHDTIVQRGTDHGWSGLASVEGVTVTSEPIAKPEQEPSNRVWMTKDDLAKMYSPEQDLDKVKEFYFYGQVLEWNRAQEKPPIEITKEYWVAQELWKMFYIAPPRNTEQAEKLEPSHYEVRSDLGNNDFLSVAVVEDIDEAKEIASRKNTYSIRPLYTAPPRKEWVGLTDEDTANICMQSDINNWHDEQVIDAVEAKLKEKNK